MKFREHRGGLEASLKTVVELEATAFALARHLRVGVSDIQVKPYCRDERIDWNTHLVLVHGRPVGFTDGPLENETKGT
jgi:hypothetical protein